VGICEQHAVTLAAGLATQGFIPVVAVYSTFLQRSYDQIIHDVCLQNLPVVFAVDRAGIVGEDGATHQGAFDISYLNTIPNIIVAAPKDEDELQHLLNTAISSGKPMAIRYPRGNGEGVPLQTEFLKLPLGKGELIKVGSDLSIFALGCTVHPALIAAQMLRPEGIDCAVINARFAKPLDSSLILDQARRTGRLVTIEENIITGGVGSGVLNLLSKNGFHDARVECIGLPDRFIEHGSTELFRAKYDLDSPGIVRRIKSTFPELLQRSTSNYLEQANR
jgi:1-deoxy-D-xylulose-5-phosphate synthase